MNYACMDLPEAARRAMITLLNSRLAESIDLWMQAKSAHWNIKGPNFIALHELFDKVAEEADGWADLLAERAVQLGGDATGTLQAVAQHPNLPAYPTGRIPWRDHVAALSKSMSALAAAVRRDIDSAGKAGDQGTADLFTEISRAIDKQLWFVESHLEKE